MPERLYTLFWNDKRSRVQRTPQTVPEQYRSGTPRTVLERYCSRTVRRFWHNRSGTVGGVPERHRSRTVCMCSGTGGGYLRCVSRSCPCHVQAALPRHSQVRDGGTGRQLWANRKFFSERAEIFFSCRFFHNFTEIPEIISGNNNFQKI